MNQPVVVPKVSPRDFFLQVLSMVSFYISVVGILMVLFQCVNLFVPDVNNFDYSSSPDNIQSILRSGISLLLIFFPVFVGTVWYSERLCASTPGLRGLWVRKWLFYLTIFLAALCFLITTVVLVNRVLDGELTTRFFLKVLSVLLTAALAFGYYLRNIRTDSVVLTQ